MENSLLGQATMEEAKKGFVGKPYIVNEQGLLEKKVKEMEDKVSFVCKQYDELKYNYDSLKKENKGLEEENRKLKLHIEAKDKAYTALLKDYEELKKDRKILDEIDAEIERFKDFRKSLEK